LYVRRGYGAGKTLFAPGDTHAYVYAVVLYAAIVLLVDTIIFVTSF
jgi:hypothetical protein